MALVRFLWHPRTVALAGAVGAVMLSASIALAATNFTLAISGSTTVFPSAVDVFNNVYSTQPVGADVAVTSPETPGQIGQPGSGVGIADLLKGQVDIADASRPLAASDNNTAGAVLQISDIDSWVVSKDGITLTVNKPSLGGTPIVTNGAGLTVAQIASIYNCSAINWSDISSTFPTVPIVAFSREITSGTYGDFLTFIGVAKGSTDGNEVATAGSEQACFGNNVTTAHDANHRRAQGNPGMQTGVNNNNNAVAYTGLGFADGANQSKVAVAGVLPTVATIDAQVGAQNGGAACTGNCYAFGRQLFMNTIKPASLSKAGVPAARATNLAKAIEFVNAALGASGQQQFANEGEAGLTTRQCTPNPSCTNTLQNGFTALPAVNITPSGGGTTQSVSPQVIPNPDVNLDRSIDITDVVLVGAGGIFGSSCVAGDVGCIRQDANEDGSIDIADIALIGGGGIWQASWQNWVL